MQSPARKAIGLVMRNSPATPTALAKDLHKRVTGKTFDKTKFALAVMAEDVVSWAVPTYITSGLVWLKKQVAVEEDEQLIDVPVGTAATIGGQS